MTTNKYGETSWLTVKINFEDTTKASQKPKGLDE